MNESMKKLIEIMDLNTILNMYIDPIKNGITFLTNDILILTTFIIIFDFMFYIIVNRADLSNIGAVFKGKLLRSVLFFLVILNFMNILEFSLKIFFDLGLAFGGGSSYINGNSFDFNLVFAEIGEMLFNVTKISMSFGANSWGLVYSLGLLAVLGLTISMIVILFMMLLMFYYSAAMAFLAFPLNALTPVADFGQRTLKGVIAAGLKISIVMIVLKVSMQIISNQAEKFSELQISPANNDIGGMLTFLLLLALINFVFVSVEAVANSIVMQQGDGLSYARLGSQVTRGITNAVSTGVTVAAIFAGGSGFVKAGADAGIKAGGMAAKTAQGVKSFSNVMNKGNKIKQGTNMLNKSISQATGGEENLAKTSKNDMSKLNKAKNLFKKNKK